ncbi:MAG: fused MFS/spermidine synthase [Deltaproteobacteria bacterium]
MGKKRAARRRPPVVPMDTVKAGVVVFISGFCTLVIELVAGRILAPHVGVSLYTWTSIIGVVLAGISLGAYLGGTLADRYPRASTLGWLLFLSGLGAFAISPLINLVGAARFHTPLMIQILIITAIIFFVPSCLLGMISPVVVKLALQNLQRTGNVVGKIYAFSTLGSILGTFATGFFLISWMGTRNILFATGAILVLCAPVFGGFFMRKTTLGVFFIIFIPLLLGLYGYAFKPPLEEGTFLFKESNYYTIQLRKNSGTRDPQLVTLYIDNLTHSCTDLNDPSHLVYRYIHVYDEVLRWQARKREAFRTLFIGGGGYTFPRYVEARYPKADIDVVEIDPEITRVSLAHLGVRKDTRIRTFNTDGRWFVMNHREKEKYDFIFLDAFNDLSVPFHLTTQEFSLQLKKLLKPDGLLLVNVIDSFNKGAFLPSYTRTLEEVFAKGKVHLITLSSSEGHIGVSNSVVMASPQALDVEDFTRSLKSTGNEETISHVMPPDRLQRYLNERHSIILTDDYVPVDNLIAPVFEELYGYQR